MRQLHAPAYLEETRPGRGREKEMGEKGPGDRRESQSCRKNENINTEGICNEHGIKKYHGFNETVKGDVRVQINGK